MLAAIRAFAKSWVARILLGLLVVSFALWGVNDAFKGNLSNDVITAGSSKVSGLEFKRLFTIAMKQVSQQQNGGQPIPTAEAVKAGLLDQVVQEIADGKSLWEMIRRAGVAPSDKLIGDEIAAIPNFINPVTGKFDNQVYISTLSQNDLTVPIFERGLRNDIAENHFTSGISVGLRPPTIYSAVMATFGFENHGAALFVINPRSVEAPSKPTDAQLQAFMTENAARLRRPEMRTIDLVRFSTAAVSQSMPVDEAEVKKRFEAAKGALTTPERRSFVQIQVRDAQMAQMVAQRLARGDDAAAIARATGAPPIVYKDAEQGALPDPAVAKAVFAMQEGQTSGPVQTNAGVAIVKVTKVTAGKAATLEEGRGQIEAALKSQAAQEKVFAQVEQYDQTHSSGATLQKAAEAAGAKVYTLGPMTAEGRGLDGKPVVGLNAQMLREAFATAQGGETEVVDIGKGEYYALRVAHVQPAALPKLDEVRPGLTGLYMQRALIERMEAKAKTLAERVRKGEPIDKVAASAGLQLSQVQNLSRASARQYQALGQPFLNQLFGAKAGEVFTAPVGQAGIAVAKAARPTPPDPRMAAAIGGAQRQQLQVSMFREVSQILRTAARERIKPRTNRDKALQAVGVSKEEAAAANAAAPKAG